MPRPRQLQIPVQLLLSTIFRVERSSSAQFQAGYPHPAKPPAINILQIDRYDRPSVDPDSKHPPADQIRREMSSFDSAPLSSPSGRIAWFCFVSVCVVVPMICCIVCCAFKIHHRHAEARAAEEENANAAISRIEANVKVFAQKEDRRRMQSIRRSMKRNLFVVHQKDLQETTIEAAIELDGSRGVPSSASRMELSSGCSICLEPFASGDTLMHSVDVHECRHVFHELCVCEWLVKQNTSSCPCCRQEFVGIETPVTSLNSPEQFQETFGAERSTPPDLEEGYV